jgi:GH25 family lysozyme M1 (1,4-beta-N-acetylmuramidase)
VESVTVQLLTGRIAAHRAREPEVPRAWSARSFRQHSDTGKVPGVGGDCDLDEMSSLRGLT